MNRHLPPLSAGPFLVLLSSFLLGPAAELKGQEEAPPQPDWSLESEVGASVFFGASDQTTVATRIEVAREGPRFEVEGDASFLYGEATDNEGETFVNKRSWSLGSNLDYRGFSRVNPYGFATARSSLEKAIRIRYTGGAGAKLTALDSESSNLDFAVAVLLEKTVEDSPDNGDSELLARWMGEFHLRRAFSGGRTVFTAKADYTPVFDELANYTVKAESSVAFKLSEVISLKLSVVDDYDSRARRRGARDNNDGRILFSVLSSF